MHSNINELFPACIPLCVCVCVCVCVFTQCYDHLLKWPELEKAVVMNIDDSSLPNLDKLWDDPYQQVSRSL